MRLAALRVARIVGPERTLGCIASMIGLALRNPGRVERTYRPDGEAYTVFRVGELDGRLTPGLHRLVTLLNAVDSAEATSDPIDWVQDADPLDGNT